MKQETEFGRILKKYRLQAEESITETATKLGIDRSYLSKLEHGHEKPSKAVLNQLISHFSLPEVEALMLWHIANKRVESIPQGTPSTQSSIRKEVRFNMNQMIQKPQEELRVNVPEGMSAVYTDSAFVTVNPNGLMLDFSQSLASSGMHNVVARVGMSYETARGMMDTLQKQIAIADQKKKETAKN